MNNNKRKPNYTNQEVTVLLKEIEKTPELVRCDNNMTSSESKQLWENIACVVSSISQTKRCADEIKAKFADLKSRTKQKCTAINKYNRETGGAPPKDLTELELILLKLTGENSNLGLTVFADTSAPINLIQSDTGLCNRRDDIIEIEILPSTSIEILPTAYNGNISLSTIPQRPDRLSKPQKKIVRRLKTTMFNICKLLKSSYKYLKIGCRHRTNNLLEQHRTNNLLEELISTLKKQ